MEGSQRRVKKTQKASDKQVKFKPCTATTGLLQQTLLSKKSPILANQSLVPLGLWYSSLTESSQGFTLATENTDWQLDHGWQAGYIRWKPQCKLPATHHGRDWEQGETLVPVSEVRSDRPQETCTKSTDVFQDSYSYYLAKQKWIPILAQGSPVLTVSEPSNTVWGHPNVFVFVLLCFLPLFPKPIVVLSKLDHFLHLLADVYPLVFAILICTDNAGQTWMEDGRKTRKRLSKKQQYWTSNW